MRRVRIPQQVKSLGRGFGGTPFSDHPDKSALPPFYSPTAEKFAAAFNASFFFF
jgi:hypothetical protein